MMSHPCRPIPAFTPLATAVLMAGCRIAYLLLALVSLEAASLAAAQSSNFQPRGGQEPITPIPAAPVQDPRRVALGEQLFRDPRLSHDNARSCLSCHDTRTNGASTNAHDLTPEGQRSRLYADGFQLSPELSPELGRECPLARARSRGNAAQARDHGVECHDGGSTPTLSEAIKKMGIAQLDRVLTNQQVAAIIAFLNTLTGTYLGQAVRPATATPGAATALP
jgi:cytochrome c peroxidase